MLGFTDRYANPKTRQHYSSELRELFTGTGRRHPTELTETDVLRWCAGLRRPAANNTVRNRLSLAATFLRWCVREGHADPGVLDALTDRDNPLRRVPRLYGKVQSKHPARWLTHDEAFGRLLGTCAGDGEVGRRDELVLRLGLAGLRAAEIIALEVGDLHLGDAPAQIRWIGKARRSRRVVVGRDLGALLGRYLAAYEAGTGRPLSCGDPVICRGRAGSGSGQLWWGRAIVQTCSVRDIVLDRAEAAGLGHVSPHDLRRTAAGILHRAKSADGGHLFDLRDIQQVLDHVDPATTQRSYLDPLDTDTKERAAALLD
jgi:integrase